MRGSEADETFSGMPHATDLFVMRPRSMSDNCEFSAYIGAFCVALSLYAPVRDSSQTCTLNPRRSKNPGSGLLCQAESLRLDPALPY